LKRRTGNTVIFGKLPLADFLFVALKINNFLGDVISGPLIFQILFLRRFRVCSCHARSVVPFFRIVFVGAISILRPGYFCLPDFLTNFIFSIFFYYLVADLMINPDFYNHERPHPSFNGQTPAELYYGKNQLRLVG